MRKGHFLRAGRNEKAKTRGFVPVLFLRLFPFCPKTKAVYLFLQIDGPHVWSRERDLNPRPPGYELCYLRECMFFHNLRRYTLHAVIGFVGLS